MSLFGGKGPTHEGDEKANKGGGLSNGVNSLHAAIQPPLKQTKTPAAAEAHRTPHPDPSGRHPVSTMVVGAGNREQPHPHGAVAGRRRRRAATAARSQGTSHRACQGSSGKHRSERPKPAGAHQGLEPCTQPIGAGGKVGISAREVPRRRRRRRVGVHELGHVANDDDRQE